jgi:hypothetical protein
MANSLTRLLALFLVAIPLIAVGQAKEGFLDARSSDFRTDRLALQGEWRWYDNLLLTPENISSEIGVGQNFPSTWNETRESRIGQGVATYRLTVLVPGDIDHFALELPQIYSSYKLWANGILIASNGTPGYRPETTMPQWLPQTVNFTAKDTLDIILQIANFHHSTGGCKEPIYLGEATKMIMKNTIARTSKIIEAGFLMVLSFAFLLLYFFRGQKKMIIYFSLLCMTWAVRSAFSNDYIFISFFPEFSWIAMVRIEYITLYLTMIWAILFLSRLFVNEGSQIIKYVLVTVNVIFVVFTMLNEPLYFTKLLAVYLVTSGLLLLYATIIVVRALINERIGSSLLTVTVLIAVAIFAYDIVTFEGWFSYNSIVFSTGYLIIFSVMAAALLLNLNIIKSAPQSPNILTYKDLYGDNK